MNSSESNGTLQPVSTPRNTTVLPHVETSGASIEVRPRNETRYQRLKRLGSGAMGEVNLVRDNDIGRTVAVKQLTGDAQNPAGLARFISEIRTIGRLEHPNIVPIHDVGVDEQGQIFFVMKHIDGETLEAILQKLDACDPEYMARYTVDYRVEIFLGLLRALQFAHAQGVVHRDIKPANIMVGRYGEVVLMDWGVAKARREGPAPAAAAQAAAVASSIGEPLSPAAFATQAGTIVGTPAYMSPEQAQGKVDEIDERSDIYSATVVFHELLAVRHYLFDRQSVNSVMFAICGETFTFSRLLFIRHPRHPPPAAHFLHFIVRGLAKDPAQRFQSVDEMISELHRVREGRCRVSCPSTMARRLIGGAGRFVDTHPKLAPFLFYSIVFWILFCMTMTTRLLLSKL
jgi:serine/threonine protein kinase